MRWHPGEHDRPLQKKKPCHNGHDFLFHVNPPWNSKKETLACPQASSLSVKANTEPDITLREQSVEGQSCESHPTERVALSDTNLGKYNRQIRPVEKTENQKAIKKSKLIAIVHRGYSLEQILLSTT